MPQLVRDRGIQFPPFGPDHLANSLHHLAELKALRISVLDPWGLGRTGFGTPGHPVIGWDDGAPVPTGGYPRGRRPSGGLWSCPADLLAFAERLLTTPTLLNEVRQPQTRIGDPMTYGLGWAIGPSGHRAIGAALPERSSTGVPRGVPAGAGGRLRQRRPGQPDRGLPAIASLLSGLQQPLTGNDLSREIDAFAT